MVRRIAHAVVVEAVDRNGSGWAGSGRCVGQHRIEELVVFQTPVGELRQRRFASEAMRRVEVRTLRRKVVVEEPANGDRPGGAVAGG